VEWKDFPAVEFVIPSFLLRQDEHGAVVSLAGGFEDVNGWKRRLPLLEKADDCEMPVASEPLCAELEWNAAPFTIVVEQAVRSLRRRAIDKVVLARRALVKPERPIILPRVLRALNDGYTDCFLYANCPAPDVCFMSATPERLAAVDGGRISAVAMAGTMPTGKNLVEEQNNRRQLQTNAKIWKEHSLVVEMIHHVLGEICDEVKMDSPEILRLRNVQHLVTPLKGLLKEGKMLTDAVALLHPTPAVCGAPRDTALGMIRTLENFTRGRFAGAAGWFDGNGNGDAAVTIRAALLHERSALLYGGAGILADSSIKQEGDETRFKMQAVLSALAQG